jgi:hypothetical protein
MRELLVVKTTLFSDVMQCSGTWRIRFQMLKVETAGASKILVSITLLGATSLDAVIITAAAVRTSHLLVMCAEGLIFGTFLTPATVISLQMTASSCQQRT